MRAEVVKVNDKAFKLMLGKHELGESKTDFDARFHMHAINDALQVSFHEGEKYLERMVAKQRFELEYQAATQEARAELEIRRAELEKGE